MNRLSLIAATGALVAAGFALVAACSSSSDDTTTPSNTEAGTSGTPTPTPPATSSGGVDSGRGDTCSPAGGQCAADCSVTGQTADPTKHCPQPPAGTGTPGFKCCVGPIDGGGSSGTSGSSGSSGSSGIVDASDDG